MLLKFMIGLTLHFAVLLPATAKNLEVCGNAVDANADSCENLKVKFDLSECEEKDKIVVPQIKCNGDSAVATYHGPHHNYRAVFEKKSAAWGKSDFALKGKIWRHLRKESIAAVKVESKAIEKPPVREVASVFTQPAPTPIPQIPKAKDEDIANLVNLLQGFSFKGSLDSYYAYNFNAPPLLSSTPTAANPQVQNKYHVFDVYHDDLQLSYARFQVQKVSGPVTTTLDFAYGPAMQIVAGTKTDASQIGLKQAYVGYKPNESFNIEAGKFVTFLGYETIESQDNWNYTRSVLFGYFVPFWHQGAKVTYAINDKLSVMGIITDGWNNSYVDNKQKNYGGQISWTDAEHLSVFLSVLTGAAYLPSSVNPETPLASRTVYDFVATQKVTDKVSLALNADYLQHSSANAFGVAAYMKYQFNEKWSLSPRIEYINDKSNLAIADSLIAGQTISTYTLTLEEKLTPNLALRFEGRTDKSSSDVFVNGNSPISSQTTGLIGLTASF